MVPTDDSAPNVDVVPSHDDDTLWDEVERALELEPSKPEVKALTPADQATWDEVEQDLEQIMGSFQGLQDDLNYRRAQDALEDLITTVKLKPTRNGRPQ